MYRHGALVLIAGLILCGAQARAAEDALPPPPPPTAPDSIIPSSPTSPGSEAPMEPPPTAPDRLPPPSGSLPPAGTLAPEDIPNPPVLPPAVAETPDTTEPGSLAPESPTKHAETEIPPEKPDEKDNPPPPPAAAETLVKPDKELDKMLEPQGEEKITEVPAPPPIDEGSSIAEKKEEAKPEAVAQISALERGRLRKIPAYQKIQPQWAFQFQYSPGALGNGDVADASEGAKATGEQFGIEFQPKFLQTVGVFGFGPTVSLYPFSSEFRVTGYDFAVWSVGAQARFQGRFFREQPFVPVIGFAWERLTYHLKNLGPSGATRDANGSIDMTGPTLGFWFLLNIIEPNQASVAYLQSGLVRSYLTAELRSMSGSDDDVDVSGNSYFVGIRVEF